MVKQSANYIPNNVRLLLILGMIYTRWQPLIKSQCHLPFTQLPFKQRRTSLDHIRIMCASNVHYLKAQEMKSNQSLKLNWKALIARHNWHQYRTQVLRIWITSMAQKEISLIILLSSLKHKLTDVLPNKRAHLKEWMLTKQLVMVRSFNHFITKWKKRNKYALRLKLDSRNK